MSILLDASARVVVQGITGRQGAFHAQRMAEAGTTVAAGVTPGRAGAVVDGLAGVPVLQHDGRGGERHRRECGLHLRAAAVRRGRDLGRHRGWAGPDRLHYRGHPDYRHAACDARAPGLHVPADRTQLPGHCGARRKCQSRHHALGDSRAWPGGGRQPQRHAHLRGGAALDRLRPGTVLRRLASAATRSSARASTMCWSSSSRTTRRTGSCCWVRLAAATKN